MGIFDRLKGEAAPAGPVAGWHPAPDRAGWLRWWDGQRWSEHYHQPGTAPATAAPRAGGPGRAGGVGHQSLRPVAPWVRPTVWQNVVGEQQFPASFKALGYAHARRSDEYGTELPEVPALVVAEPDNRYDGNAVAVWVQGHQVGYLPRDDAARYSAVLRDLAEQGLVLQVSARVWIAPADDERAGSVTVVLPPPEGVQPFNALPEEPHTVLPLGAALQLTGEADHMDVLEPFTCDRGRYLAVTLHLVEEARTPRSAPYRAVEARLAGARVGVLTKASSEKLADLVAYVADRGRVPVARAQLQGSALRAEVTLLVARSHEVSTSWLERVQPVRSAGDA